MLSVHINNSEIASVYTIYISMYFPCMIIKNIFIIILYIVIFIKVVVTEAVHIR